MTDLHTTRPTSGPDRPPPSTPPWYVATVAAVLAAIVTLLVVLVVVAIRDDGDQDVQTVAGSTSSTDATLPTTTDPTPTTDPSASTDPTDADTTDTSSDPDSTTTSTPASTTPSASTTAPSTATTSSPTSQPASFVPAVWPWFDSSTRYDDPVDAARGFATDLAGFRDPVLGPYLSGDGRSGEVEIRPDDDGPITTVFVRQVTDDDSWWVVGAVTANIQLTSPDVLDEVASPLVVRGRAMAFEGTVDLDLFADGSATPIASGFVTGGGAELAPFEGSFDFDSPGVPGGAIVLRTISADDGQVWEATVTRIRLR